MRERIIWIPADSTPEDIADAISMNDGPPRYFRVRTPTDGDRPINLLREGLTSDSVRKLVVALANQGFSLYFNNMEENRFIRHDRIFHHWEELKSGPLQASESGIIYEYEAPETGQAEQLVVIFSPISSIPRLRRFNWRSFAGMMKYVAPGTAILRIADLGGVKGAFYLDTTYLPSNSRNIQDLIHGFSSELGVSPDHIVLYGASKGGTGATYHGLRSGLKFLAVDPVLSDDWYETHESDYHYTSGGVFPRSKQDTFANLIVDVQHLEGMSRHSGVVVTSERSPQYGTVVETLAPLAESLLLLNSRNSSIREHPDVAPNTIYAQLMAINSLLTNVELPSGELVIP